MISYKQFILAQSNFKFSAKEAYALALRSGKRLSPEIADIVKKDHFYARKYAENIIKGRWKAAEPYIKPNEMDWNDYLWVVWHYDNEPAKLWKWIKEEGPTENLMDILLYIDSEDKDLQEYIITHRPDLINQIETLHPALREKYKYELNMAEVDI